MTQTEPKRLLTTRAVSSCPVTGWASYPRMIAVCSARGHARTADLLTDISSFQAVRRHDGRCGPIEFSRARHRPEICLSAGSSARSRMPGRRDRTAASAYIRAGSGGFPATEFISVRSMLCRAPMNRSLDWDMRSCCVSRIGRVANLGHSIFHASEGVIHGNCCKEKAGG